METGLVDECLELVRAGFVEAAAVLVHAQEGDGTACHEGNGGTLELWS